MDIFLLKRTSPEDARKTEHFERASKFKNQSLNVLYVVVISCFHST